MGYAEQLISKKSKATATGGHRLGKIQIQTTDYANLNSSIGKSMASISSPLSFHLTLD